MPKFLKYQHVEKIYSQECEGILDGICHVFYKIDGSNGSIWIDEKEIKFGSRNRELNLDNDNAGFMNCFFKDHRFRSLFEKYYDYILYGEWLVPHSFKCYRKDAWKRFYVFDVLDTQSGRLLPYEAYKGILDEFEIDYVPPLAIIKNPTEEDLYRLLQNSGQFLVEDGKGKGEGIVIKNYDWINKYGRQTWAKIITNEFKEVHHKEMGAPEINGTALVEEQIIRDFLTDAFIEKEKAKIALTNSKEVSILRDGFVVGRQKEPCWESKLIPELLGRCWHEFISEEMTEILKKYKNPKINFRLLNSLLIKRVKEVIGV